MYTSASFSSGTHIERKQAALNAVMFLENTQFTKITICAKLKPTSSSSSREEYENILWFAV
jgi:hypothetical protein